MEFIKELKKLGLNDKESAVYVACLELGPSPVQAIARKSKVVRATTYVILEALMQRGLVTHFKQGKKTLYSAEPPRQLMRLIEKQEEELKVKHRELEVLLPELQMLMKAGGEKPSVRYFEGKEGLLVMRQEIVRYSRSGDTIYNFTPMEHLDAVFPQVDDNVLKQRLAKGIHAKTIFTTRSKRLHDMLMSQTRAHLLERRFVPPENFPGNSGMTIYRDRIAIGSFTGKLTGVIIESETMSDMMRRLFEIAWLGASALDTSVAKPQNRA